MYENLKSHPFFSGLDFEKLFEGEVPDLKDETDKEIL
jgi:hypothetical protein